MFPLSVPPFWLRVFARVIGGIESVLRFPRWLWYRWRFRRECRILERDLGNVRLRIGRELAPILDEIARDMAREMKKNNG